MSRKMEHPFIRSYLDRVCSHVKATELHEDVRQEMLGHLEDLVEEKMKRDGKSEEDAIAEAVGQMGDPDRVGRQLHAAHKPKPEWSVILLVAGMIVVGFVTLFALDLSLSGDLLMGRKLLFGLAGVAAMIGLYFADYRRLLRYSWVLYGGTLLMMSAPLLQGTRINGTLQWLIVGNASLNVYAASPYLLIASIAGIIQGQRLDSKDSNDSLQGLAKNVVIFMLIPVIFFMQANALSYLMIYGLSLSILLWALGKKKLLAAGFVSLVLCSPFLFFKPLFAYRWTRLTAFINPEADARGDGFMTLRSVEAIRSGGMWGQGFGIVNREIPYSNSELMYSYLVYSLGWVFGIAVALLVLMFLIRVARMGLRLQDDFAKSLVVGLSTVIGVQFVWNLLMCAGYMPIIGVQLPIMNWSSGTIIELAAVGLMLSAYRRKDMIASYQTQVTRD